MDNRYSMAFGMGFDILNLVSAAECDCQEELGEYCELCAGDDPQ